MASKPVNTLSDNRTVAVPFPASLAISIGDLLYWDTTNHQAKPLTSKTTLASEALDQVDAASVFLGVATDQRLSTETDANGIRVVQIDGVYDFDCVSGTYRLGDLLGVTWNGGSALVNQVVTKVTNVFGAVAVVVQDNSSGSLTRVRGRMMSRFCFDLLTGKRGVGGQQGVGVTTLTDAAQVLTVFSNPILNMVPTAARNVTLPAEANSAGLKFYFTNNSAGAFSVTFKASDGATAIKGNGVVPQNKTGVFWCDGTNWNGSVSA